MAKKILITGGCRSGKSRWALALTRDLPGDKMYIATAEALDSEMKERIGKHQRERGAEWETHEVPRGLLAVFQQLENRSGVLILDCLTLWISNLMVKGQEHDFILKEADRLVDQIKNMQCQVVVVTNEVGAGIVPDNKLARDYRDLVGEINQRFAGGFDTVIHMVSGIPVMIKGK